MARYMIASRVPINLLLVPGHASTSHAPTSLYYCSIEEIGVRSTTH